MDVNYCKLLSLVLVINSAIIKARAKFIYSVWVRQTFLRTPVALPPDRKATEEITRARAQRTRSST